MKKKSFERYLEKRLDKKEIAAIEEAAKIEYDSIIMLQQDVAKAVKDYMDREKIGFNDFVRRLGKSPAQVSKIIKGEANLTLASVAQIYAIMGFRAKIVIDKKR